MAAKQGVKRKRIKPRNPVAPVARRLRPKVEPSERTYSRKTKHKPPETENDNET